MRRGLQCFAGLSVVEHEDVARSCRESNPDCDLPKAFAAEPDFLWAPINSLEDVVADEQFHAAGGIVYVPDGDGSVPMVATLADFHGTPWVPRSVAPGIGEHTDEILAELTGRGA
jgi:crotonobetainyl-CoA:carnitine CoA-transferase CaiB-like acyl-CoA transferase